MKLEMEEATLAFCLALAAVASTSKEGRVFRSAARRALAGLDERAFEINRRRALHLVAKWGKDEAQVSRTGRRQKEV
jgi:hypothetical protein